MANALYPLAKQTFLSGTTDIDMDNGDVRVMLTLNTYTYASTDQYLGDMPSTDYDNGRSATLTNPTIANGVFNADDTSLTATAASASDALILYIHTGNDATSPLIAYIDTGTGLPLTPGAGGTVNITWDTTIFSL